MKATIQLVTFALLFLVVACGPKGKKVEAGEAVATPKVNVATTTTYDLNRGILKWTGSKAIGGSFHTGTISASDGNIKVKDGNVVGGNFSIDMNSITNLDQEPGKGKEKLEGHLKSPDFFDVQQFPIGTFEIASVDPVTGQEDITHNVTGNLTLKGMTKSITIPANVAIVGNKLTAVSPAFKIDRTQWGVEYGASSIEGIAKDKVISNDIALVLDLEATANAPVQ